MIITFDAERAWTAIESAAAIGRADRTGSVEPGKWGDLVLWRARDLDYICYRVGSNLTRHVIKKGSLVR